MKIEQKSQGKMDIIKGDTVLVLTGKDNGRRGKVLQAFPKNQTIVVEGINIVIKHQKPRGTQKAAQSQQSGRIEKPAPMPRCKVMLVCPRCEKPTRVGHGIGSNGEHVRICKKCGEHIQEA